MEHDPGSASQPESGLTQRLKRDSQERVETGKRTAADHISEVAQALERARAQLEQKEPTLAAYTSRVASGVGNLATRLRDSSLDELLEDTRRLARQNPALFLAGAAAAGFVLARFLKASEQRVIGAEYSARPATEPTVDLDAGSVAASGAPSMDDPAFRGPPGG